MSRVVFVAGNDAAQMLGACLNWARWMAEERGVEIDWAGALSDWMGKAQAQNFLQVVGWDGPEPVAMMEIRANYNSMLHRTTLYGDHAYVHPDYRNEGVFTEMADFAMDTGRLIGHKHWIVPVTAGADATAPWLRSVYERAGFSISGITMHQGDR